MKTVVGLFDDFANTKIVVHALIEAGLTRDEISVMAADKDGRFARELHTSRLEDQALDGIATGAAGGGVLGGLTGLVLGIGALVIPGLGPIIAAGPIVASITGATIGATTGGVVGALASWNIPEDQAEYYAEGVRRGGTLVAVTTTDARVDAVSSILADYNPVNIMERSAMWRQEGWEHFEADEDSFATYEPSYRRHFVSFYGENGRSFAEYGPSYRLGHDFAHNEVYRDAAWEAIEMEAQRTWELSEANDSWDEVKEAVRHGWQAVKDAFSTNERTG